MLNKTHYNGQMRNNACSVVNMSYPEKPKEYIYCLHLLKKDNLYLRFTTNCVVLCKHKE